MSIHAYVLFKVSSGSERLVCQKIIGFDEVLAAGIVYGEYDVIAKVSLQDMKALESFLSVKMRKVPNVLVTSTMIVAREYEGKFKRKRNKA
jgi:anthranilate phosphoribosyltransferase